MMISPLDIAFLVTRDAQSGTFFRYHGFALGLMRRGHRVTVYSQDAENRGLRRDETRDGVRYVLAPSAPGNRFFDFARNPLNLVRRTATILREPASAAHQVYHLFQPFEAAAWQWQWHFYRRRGGQGRGSPPPLFAWDWDDLWYGGLVLPEELETRRKRRRWRSVERLEHELPRVADVVTTCSKYLADRALERGARDAVVIHNGSWLDDQAKNGPPPPAERAATRAEFGLEPRAFYLGFIGWTLQEADLLVGLLARVDDPGVRLACCGYDLREKFAAVSPALAARVDYLGILPAERANQLMRVLDVGLLPLARNAFNESRLPIKFSDYLAAGLPVFCSDVGEVGRLGRELPGVTFLADGADVWAQALRRFMADPGASRPDRKALREKLSWPVLAEQLEGVYAAHLKR